MRESCRDESQRRSGGVGRPWEALRRNMLSVMTPEQCRKTPFKQHEAGFLNPTIRYFPFPVSLSTKLCSRVAGYVVSRYIALLLVDY